MYWLKDPREFLPPFPFRASLKLFIYLSSDQLKSELLELAKNCMRDIMWMRSGG